MASPPEFRWFLGIDLGTSGLRAVVLDPGGKSRLSLRKDWPRDGAQSQEAWWDGVRTMLRGIVGRLPPGPFAIAVDGTSGTLLAVDAGGRPLGSPLMYHDARARAQAERLRAIAPMHSGAHGPASSAAKLLWLRDNRLLNGAARVLHQAEWITARLRGVPGHGDENNALKLGYDPVARRWPDWWLTELGANAGLLPEVVPAGSPLGPIDPRIAIDTGLDPRSVVVAGTTDGVAGFLATGVDDTRTGVTSLGSTLILKQLCERPLFDPESGVYSHRVLGRWLAGGASNSGGAVLAAHFSGGEIAALSRHIDADRNTGLDYYPLTAPGERFPNCEPLLAPRLTPRPADDALFLQGLLEGIGRIEAAGYDRLAALGAARVTRVVTVGGGARNAAWSAIRARLTGVRTAPAEHEEPAHGAALLARHGVAR